MFAVTVAFFLQMHMHMRGSGHTLKRVIAMLVESGEANENLDGALPRTTVEAF